MSVYTRQEIEAQYTQENLTHGTKIELTNSLIGLVCVGDATAGFLSPSGYHPISFKSAALVANGWHAQLLCEKHNPGMGSTLQQGRIETIKLTRAARSMQPKIGTRKGLL